MTPAQAKQEVRAIIAQAEQSDDPRFGVRLVRARIAELNAAGEDVPDELTWIEKRFIADCIDASQGR